MINLLLFLLFALIITVTFECFVGDIYFNNGCRKHYYRILKSIYNMLIIIFIFLHRNYILSMKGLSGVLFFSCGAIALVNIFYIAKDTKVLKEEDAL
ncbi:hypothetical protein KQI86_04645 [Clostridium sp. MSJ-11]|uniref:Uncharacterized protein n=1 Tax=Clostridium mobile TaxID=2841512 RepID=A0ABS6EFR9_9CLOT|nr:hypothetical protein [Clostridium mobile]MBU5483607.1 hypothetical protein [Clostridium mobile]